MAFIIGQSNSGKSLWLPPSMGQNPSAKEDTKLVLLDTNGTPLPKEILEIPQGIIVPDEKQIKTYTKSTFINPTDHLYNLFSAIEDSLDINDKNSAQIFFRHFSSSDDNALLLHNDREFDEITHVLAKNNSKPHVTKNTFNLTRFDTTNSKKQIDDLIKFLFNTLNKKETSSQERRTALRILFHGIAYFGNYDWQDHIPSFAHLLESPNSSIRSFTEQSLKCLVKYIDDDNAKLILKNLTSSLKLHGDLAQEIFDKFNSLKEEYESHDSRLNFKELTATEISRNIDYYSNLACNQANPHIDSTGNIGIEIEMKLRGASQSRDGNSVIYQELLSDDNISRLFIMGVDGYGQAAEIRSKRDGFPLNYENRQIIRKLACGLQSNPDLCFLLSNHINVDATDRGHVGRLLNYRRDNGHYWESISCPITIPSLSLSTNLTSFRGRVVASSIDDGYLPYCLEASTLCDLMTVHDVMRSATHLHMSDLSKLTEVLSPSNLETWRKEDFYHPQNQETIARVLIYQAKMMGKDDVIPAILRLHKYKTLPALGVFSEAITSFALGNFNLSEVVRKFSNYNGQTVTNFINRALANGQPIAMSPIIRSILKSNGDWSGYLIDKLEPQDIGDLTVREILLDSTYSLSSRRNLATKIKEFDYDDNSKDLFTSEVPLAIQLELGGKISQSTKEDFAPIAKELREKDWKFITETVTSSIKDRLEKSNLIEVLKSAINHNTNSLLTAFSFNEDIARILKSNISTSNKNLLANRLVPCAVNPLMISLFESTNRECAQVLDGKIAKYYGNSSDNIELTAELSIFIERAIPFGKQAASAIATRLVPASYGFDKVFTNGNFIVNDKIPLDLRISFVRKCSFTLDDEVKALLINDRIPEDLRVEVVRRLEVNAIDSKLIDLLEGFSRTNHVIQAIKRKIEDYCSTQADNLISFDENITKLYAIQSRLFRYVPFEGLFEKLEAGNLDNQHIVAFLKNGNINWQERQAYATKLSAALNQTGANFLADANIDHDVRKAIASVIQVTSIDQHLVKVFSSYDCNQQGITNIINQKLGEYLQTLEDDSLVLSPEIVSLFASQRLGSVANILIQKLQPGSLSFLSNESIPWQARQAYVAKLVCSLDESVANSLVNANIDYDVRKSTASVIQVTSIDQHLVKVFSSYDCNQQGITNIINQKLGEYLQTLEDDSLVLSPEIVSLFASQRLGSVANILIQKLQPGSLSFLSNESIPWQARQAYAAKLVCSLDESVASSLVNANIDHDVRKAIASVIQVTSIDQPLVRVFSNYDCNQQGITDIINQKLGQYLQSLDDDSLVLSPEIISLFASQRLGSVANILIQKLQGLPMDNPLVQSFMNNRNISTGFRENYQSKCLNAS